MNGSIGFLPARCALLWMGLDLSREAERLSSLVHAVGVGERSTTEAHAPRRLAT